MQQRSITVAFGLCFALALFASSRAQIGPAPGGGGGGTPCTTTALSVQYNNSGAFGCSPFFVDDANSVAQRNGTNRQVIYSYNTYTDASNYERARIGWPGFDSNNFYLYSEAAGSGTARPIKIASGQRLYLGGSGDTQVVIAPDLSALYWITDASMDIGLSSTDNRPRNGFFSAELNSRSFVSRGTVPGISGCTAGTQTGGGTAGTFVSGTTGTCTVVLTFAFTAPTGWACNASNRTTANLIRQSASSTTTATIVGVTVTSDVISFGCMAY